MIDLDSFIGEVYGYEKQGAGYGYTHKLGSGRIIAARSDTGEVLRIRDQKAKRHPARRRAVRRPAGSPGCAAPAIRA